jgi:hypothetical protein
MPSAVQAQFAAASPEDLRKWAAQARRQADQCTRELARRAPPVAQTARNPASGVERSNPEPEGALESFNRLSASDHDRAQCRSGGLQGTLGIRG